MKIAMIGHKRVPSREGGIEVVVTELSARMAELGHKVFCYNRWDSSLDRKLKKERDYRGVRLISVRTSKKDSLNAIIYSFLAAVRAVCGHYDVIHIHAEGPASMALITHIFRIPTVVTIHGLDWQRAKWGGFATRFLQFGERMAAKYADEVIVLSKSNEQYFLDKYNRQTLFVPNGMSVQPCMPPDEITKRWGLEKDGYILFLARIVPEKGLHYLIDAFGKLETDKKLVIAGDITKDNEYISKICGMAAKDKRIVMTNFVQGNVLKELLGNAGVYVLPSDIEGMSISLLEALSYGRRCLLSDIPENRETAGEYARYFPKGDVEGLCSVLGELLSESQNTVAAQKQIDYVQKRFDWNAITDTTLDIYEKAIVSHHNIKGIHGREYTP